MTRKADNASRNANAETEICLSMTFAKLLCISLLEYNQHSFFNFECVVFVFSHVFQLIPK